MFPALLLMGMPPVIANATSTVAALPGLVAGIRAYQPDLRNIRRLCVVGNLVLNDLLLIPFTHIPMQI